MGFAQPPEPGGVHAYDVETGGLACGRQCYQMSVYEKPWGTFAPHMRCPACYDVALRSE
jgi:hypothetical protein